ALSGGKAGMTTFLSITERPAMPAEKYSHKKAVLSNSEKTGHKVLLLGGTLAYMRHRSNLDSIRRPVRVATNERNAILKIVDIQRP
ncbi:MAG: hypothetical protein M0P30_14085, partial [Syntrophorhabdaceae bacterium]|nr:hypothetical protein [Syntrophorhabdaceae bacterium]